MAIIVVASFVPSFARAEAPAIEEGLSLINELSAQKTTICHGVDKAKCEAAHDDVTRALRELVAAEKAKAAAKLRGDQAEVTRLNHEIIRIGTEGTLKNQIVVDQFLPKQTTVGAKN